MAEGQRITGGYLLPKKDRRRRRRGGFVEATIEGISKTLESTVFYEGLAQKTGLLQRVDPRVKLAGLLAMILGVSLAQRISTLVVWYVVALLLAIVSRVPLGFFVKRVWLFMPFFTGVVAAPVIFNFVTPGQPLLTLLDLGAPRSLAFLYLPSEITLTQQGVRSALFLILRVADSVSFAVLLVTTTRWVHLLKALSVLRVPQVFILIMAMTYRYIFVLLQTTNAMLLAKKSRSIGEIGAASNRRLLAANAGTLLAKSYHLSNEIYSAMLSRGFTGDAKVMDEFRISGRDWGFLLGLACLAVSIAVMERI